MEELFFTLAPQGLLGLHSYTTDDHLPRGGTTGSEKSPPQELLTKKLPHMPIRER